MNRLHVYRLLRRNAKLAEKRHPALEQSTVAKVMLYIGGGLMMIYLIFLGSILGRVAAEEDMPVLLLVVLPFFLVLDFLFRFIGQQTPLVFVKPYLLMPVRAQHVIELYLLNQVLSSYNLLWLSLLLPYAYVCLVAGIPFWSVVGVVVGGLLMVMANAQWYLLVRTLVVRSVLWWALPLVVAAATAAAVYLIIDADLLDAVDTVLPMPSSSGCWLSWRWQPWLACCCSICACSSVSSFRSSPVKRRSPPPWVTSHSSRSSTASGWPVST